jgi:trimeric autotransporter adhesin
MKKLIFGLICFILYFPITSIGQTWFTLGSGMNKDIAALGLYNGNLYAEGDFDTAGGSPANYIAKWNGTSWSGLGKGLYSTDQYGQVCALINYNGNLVVGGYFDSAGGHAANNIAEWDGTNWSNLGVGTNYIVKAFTIYKGNLIAAGNFSTAGGILSPCIAEWNGTSWDSLGSGMNGAVGAVIVYKGNLIAGGNFTIAGGQPVSYIAEWNGTSWSALGSGLSWDPNALDTLNGSLYAGGSFTTAGGNPASNIAKWDGTAWSPLGSGINNIVLTITTYNGNLYAGGSFDSAGGLRANNIAKWNGSSWSALCSGMNNAVGALIVYDSNLYSGGYFDTAGEMPANYIAGLNDTAQCKATGIEQLTNTISITLYPNPSTGIFTISFAGAQNFVPATMEIYNVLGEKVTVATLKQVHGDHEINISSQPTGVYLYRIITEDGSLVGEGKMVVQK